MLLLKNISVCLTFGTFPIILFLLLATPILIDFYTTLVTVQTALYEDQTDYKTNPRLNHTGTFWSCYHGSDWTFQKKNKDDLT